MTVSIRYRPNVPQKRFHRACNKQATRAKLLGRLAHVALSAGMGTGKTLGGAQEAVRCMAENPGTTGMVISPSYPIAKMRSGAISHVIGILETAGILHKYNKSDHELYVPAWDATAQFISAQYPERIVSMSASWCWMDEPGMFTAEVFERAVSRTREKKSPRHIMFATGTPEGYTEFYNYAVKNPPKLMHHITGSTIDNISNLAPGYINDMMAQYPQQVIDSYLYGKFTNLSFGSVFSNFDPAVHVHRMVIRPTDDIWVGCDFNVSPMAWIIGQAYTPQMMPWSGAYALDGRQWNQMWADRILVIPERGTVTRSHTTTADTAHALCGHLNELGWHGSAIRVTGDASGHSHSTKSRETDYEVLEQVLRSRLPQCRIIMETRRQAPSQRDSINVLNGRLRASTGHIGLIIDPDNHDLIDDLTVIRYDDNGNIDKSLERGSNPRGHWGDALRYLAYELRSTPIAARAL